MTEILEEIHRFSKPGGEELDLHFFCSPNEIKATEYSTVDLKITPDTAV